MDNLPEFNLPRISKRDLKIYDLKKKGKSFYQIADILYNENYEENLSADAIRMAYNKINKDIESVFRRKTK